MTHRLSPHPSRTERRAAWLARLERWTEWPLTALALALVPILLAPYLLSLSDDTLSVLIGLDYLIWGIFAADLLVKLTVAPHRLRYLRAHWFDVVLVALPMLRPLRVVRSLRAVRVLRAGRAGVAAARGLVGVRRALTRRGVHYTAATALVVVVAAGALVTAIERDAPDASIRTLSDGLWWAATTVTTVGYGDTYPTTPAGRGVAVALMVLGIALFGVLTANLAALLVEDKEDEVLAQLREVSERLRRLEERVRDDEK
ncbi:MAG: potassium channel family protein [Chloroflexota bacterium]|nr:potassium channel family protein [Chloroflexota bacterium]